MNEISHAGAVRKMRTSLRFPSPCKVSVRKKAAPFCENGSALPFKLVIDLSVALRR